MITGRRRRAKRMLNQYELGGDAYMGMAAGAGFLGEFADVLTPEDEFGYSKGMVGKSALKGAASGAAIGTSIMPVIGTAVGAGVGALTGWIGGQKQKDAAEEAREEHERMLVKNIRSISNARMVGHDPFGTRREFGGELNPLSDNALDVVGRQHEEGGVKFPSLGVELEGGETIENGLGGDPDSNYIFSDTLGFAKKHRRLARQMGKLEKKPKNREVEATKSILNNKIEALKDEQEALKESLGLGVPIARRVRDRINS